MKVKIFIDFWNFQLSWNEYHANLGASSPIKIPWDKGLPQVLLSKVGDDCDYVGTHVYASINPKKRTDRGLNSFLQIMNTFEGYQVSVKQRRPAKPVRCNNEGCRKEILSCPHCSKELIRTVEKGVDTTIAIELFQYGLDGVYDKAVLVSGDEDLVPAVEFIQRKGKYIIHAGWSGQSNPIRQACWSHILFDKIMVELLPPAR
jgi:hypothetical protein